MDMKMKGVLVEEPEKTNTYTNRPYKKMRFPGRRLKGWMEMAMRKGISNGSPEFCLTKKVTRTDTCRNQHRYQLTIKDVNNSKWLRVIADRAMASKEEGLNVNILDREGRHYVMQFRHIESNGYFRFMGDGWTEFLDNVQLREHQFMTIWALPRDEEERIVTNWRVPGVVREEEVEEVKREQYWFVFVNTEEEVPRLLPSLEEEEVVVSPLES